MIVSTPAGAIPTVAWRPADGKTALPGAVALADQTKLPFEQVAVVCRDVASLCDAIRRLVVRGAPAIGVAAAYGTVIAAQEAAQRAAPTTDSGFNERFRSELTALISSLRTARPTAVNLAWSVDRCMSTVGEMQHGEAILVRLFAEALKIHAEDEAACLAMGRNCAPLVRKGGTYLTHCNTGRFAATGIGTAFGAFVVAHADGKDPFVYAGEVRPLLQGARLTAYELRERGIRGALLPDSAAGALLASGRIEGVFVGADRIAANGDTANKIGTYSLAELARANGVPFHVVAPTSTIDASICDGSLIPIEERAADEVLGFRGTLAAPAGFPVFNPAFDVTPARLVSSIVTERALLRPPFSLDRA